jgi:hypothetical protein
VGSHHRRVRPRDAAVAAQAVPGLRRSERALLEQLLRMSRGDEGVVPWRRGTSTIAADIHYSVVQVKRARRALVRLGLIKIDAGVGSVRTAYQVNLAALVQEVPSGDQPVNPGENSESPPSEEGSSRSHPGVMVTPPSGLHDPTYTRARRSTRSSRTTPQPPASGGQPAVGPKCPKAASRGQPCPSCRICGTTPRQLEATHRRDQKAAEVADRKATQLAQRQAVEAARAARAAGPSPAYLAAREALITQPTQREARV